MDRNTLAEAAGISYPYLSQLETGYRTAAHPTQLAIAGALGVGLDDLFATEELRGSLVSSTPEAPPPAPSLSSSARPTLSEVVAVAVDAIESLPRGVRLDALNQIQRRIMDSMTSSRIERLAPGEVFVFGSNAHGLHDGGAARDAFQKFGAVWGEGHGHHGQSYAIDTMSGFDTLSAEVDTFLGYARAHPELRFQVTPIGTGIADYRPDQIAPLFAGKPENVVLPVEFSAWLDREP
ncbi:helix-turn-helix domain-containing protein [Mycobacterium sp. M1]|uniref:Helix-turn-helix domain-containing protein n=2 Tax=Mycolicibacter acidiphilus TaxID=2835306 RepID=A0ABS5RMC2_9MYCO|nr:helix-turn-helix domain-containing protein [Mycolicibacter acidiphilus]